MDTRFSIAIHLLILITEAESPLSSAQMAQSVGTNASFARKVLGALKKAGMIDSTRGATGYVLTQSPSDISLLQIYKAIYDEDTVELFGIHRNPNDECLVGRYIQPILKSIFREIQSEAERKMETTTLASCIADMRKQAHENGDL